MTPHARMPLLRCLGSHQCIHSAWPTAMCDVGLQWSLQIRRRGSAGSATQQSEWGLRGWGRLGEVNLEHQFAGLKCRGSKCYPKGHQRVRQPNCRKWGSGEQHVHVLCSSNLASNDPCAGKMWGMLWCFCKVHASLAFCSATTAAKMDCYRQDCCACRLSECA